MSSYLSDAVNFWLYLCGVSTNFTLASGEAEMLYWTNLRHPLATALESTKDSKFGLKRVNLTQTPPARYGHDPGDALPPLMNLHLYHIIVEKAPPIDEAVFNHLRPTPAERLLWGAPCSPCNYLPCLDRFLI